MNQGALDSGWYTPVFVGGMARSGTTLLSALLSTSVSCSPFTPELHCLASVVQAVTSLALPHQSVFYFDRKLMSDRYVGLIKNILDEAWSALGKPRFLVIKHCTLTTVFATLARALPQARFLVIMRDARDMAASMLRIALRGRPVTQLEPWHQEQFLSEWIVRFNSCYGAVLAAANVDLKGRFLAVDHRKLCGEDVHGLNHFLGVTDIDPKRLWERAAFDVQSCKSDMFFSPGWGRPLAVENSRSFLDVLSPEGAHRVVSGTQIVRMSFAALVQTSGSGKKCGGAADESRGFDNAAAV